MGYRRKFSNAAIKPPHQSFSYPTVPPSPFQTCSYKTASFSVAGGNVYWGTAACVTMHIQK